MRCTLTVLVGAVGYAFLLDALPSAALAWLSVPVYAVTVVVLALSGPVPRPRPRRCSGVHLG